ncbi:cotranscriptional regulator ARB2A isoform X5 [Halichoerus grypus]|uniref:cotranscriptional regulator FAM172A isoform X6 n=1 Tax=Halichoerus grypus TaxID=9711 RepID=UPI001659CE14|nr:cotranscriptional regulator FAM172A isoform X6 [Halichoerus grypus]
MRNDVSVACGPRKCSSNLAGARIPRGKVITTARGSSSGELEGHASSRLPPQPCSWGQSSDLLSRIDLDELMKKDEPPLDFPDTLEGFEYAFNEKGQLRHIKTGEPFVFNYREDLHRWNQKRYEALGEIITKYVYELLEKDCNLKKISIPEGYGVIVLNPNENYIEVEKPKIHVQSSSDSSDEPAEKRERKDKVSKETKKRRDFYEKYRNPQREKEMMQLYIRENGSPEEHAIYVWDHFIAQSAAENVFFVAHSYGGLAFVELMIQREADVKSKVTAVALTDSVHNVWHQEAGKTIREWMRENCCNWVSSSEPLDTSVESMLPDCPRVSAACLLFLVKLDNLPSGLNTISALTILHFPCNAKRFAYFLHNLTRQCNMFTKLLLAFPSHGPNEQLTPLHLLLPAVAESHTFAF